MTKGSKSRYGKIQGDKSTKAGGREPEAALSFARRIQSSSNSDSPGGAFARETYSIANVSTAVIEMASLTTRREDCTAKYDEYGGAGFPKYAVVHRKEVGHQAGGCATVG